METPTDLTSIFFEPTQFNPLLTPKEESFFISSFLFLLQTPERFTHSNVPQNVIKLLQHKYALCIPGIKEPQERSVFDNESLHSLDPSLHPGLLFLQFSPISLISDWIDVTFVSKDNIIQVSNLHMFRYTLEVIFTHLHTSKHTTSSIQASVISEFLSSQNLTSDRQNSQFFLSLSRIFKLFSRDALMLLLSSNRNGDVLLDSLIAALFTEHSDTYSYIIQCLTTLLTQLDFHIWKYIKDDLSLLTSLVVSPCLLKTLEDWSSASDLNELVFNWCIPYFSSLQTEVNAIKHSKILFKWLSYLSNYASSHPDHRYSKYTFLDIILETLPKPGFASQSPLACAASRLFSNILLIAFEERLFELLISTKEDWLPLFLAIRTAFFKEQSPTVQSQLSFKYFQKDNKFNLTSFHEDSPHLEVFRLCHEFIVKVFNSGLEKSASSAENIVALCKQRQPINKVGTKIVCLLKELKLYYEMEESKPSLIIDLIEENDSDNDTEKSLPDPDMEEVYSRDCIDPEKVPDSISENLVPSSTMEEIDCDLDMDIFDDYDLHMASVRKSTISKSDDYSEIDFSDEEISSTTFGPVNSTQLSHGHPFSPLECKKTFPNFPSVEIPDIKNGLMATKNKLSNDPKTSKDITNQDKHKTETKNSRKRKMSGNEFDNPSSLPLIVKVNLKLLDRKPFPHTKLGIKKSSPNELKRKSTSNILSRTLLNENTNNLDSTVSPTSTSHSSVFDISYDTPTKSYDSISSEDKTEANHINNKPITDESAIDITPTHSTQDYDQLRQDLYLSQRSIDEIENSPIILKKTNTDKKSNSILKYPKRKKTNVTTMRPPFSRSRLTTLTESTPETAIQKSYKESLYKNTDFKVPNSRPSPPNPANISLNLPDIDKEISPGKIKRMNEAAKHDIQPRVNPVLPGSPLIMRLSKKPFANPSPKRLYTEHAQGTSIVTNPTSKINPEEFIDKILTWSPDHFLNEGSTPTLPTPSHISLSYTNYDDYKYLFMNFLLHEVWSNLEEDLRSANSNFREYTFSGLHPYTQQCALDKQRFVLAKFQFFTNPDNEMEVVESLKEQDIVLMKVNYKDQAPEKETRLFGFVSRVQMSRCVQPEGLSPPNQHNYRGFSKVLISLKYNTSHVSAPFLKAALKPIVSLTTFSRQWRGLINLYRNPICKYILSPNLRVCDPPHASSLSRVRILNESLFNESQKVAIAKVTSMVSEPYVCPRIALLLGPPGCGKSHTITGCVQSILHAVSSDRSKQHILLCAPSNASADELAIKMLERGLINTRGSTQQTSSRDNATGKLSLIRLGQLEQVHPLIKPLHIDSLMHNAKLEDSCRNKAMLKEQERLQCQFEGQVKQLEKELTGLKMQHQLLDDKGVITQDIRETEATKRDLQTKLSNSNREVNRLQALLQKDRLAVESRIRDNLLSNVNIILTTLSSSGISLMEELFKTKRNNPMHFSCVIVDEATQCNELDILIPLQFMITKLVLTGDPNQLPAVVRSRLLRGLGYETSLFERFKLFFKSTCTKSEPVILLDTQYRMHPEICHFPNCTFYDSQLQTAPEVKLRASTDLDPYLFFHISYGKEYTNKPGQIINAKEIEFVASLVRELLTKYPPSSIGIITPYLAQQRELTKIIHVYSNRIDIKSVDGFQGKEKDIIIISCVRSKSKNGTIGFLSNAKRINVAITRAKKALYIVGDVDSLKRNETWCKLIEDADRRERLLTIDSERVEDCLRRIWLNKSERI